MYRREKGEGLEKREIYKWKDQRKTGCTRRWNNSLPNSFLNNVAINTRNIVLNIVFRFWNAVVNSISNCDSVPMNPGKMVPEKWSPGRMVPGESVLGKMVSGKLVPGKLRNKKPWEERRASWCVCGMLRCDQSMKTQNSETNPKLGNEKSWGERRASWCVCGMFGCDQPMKTQNLTTNLPGLL